MAYTTTSLQQAPLGGRVSQFPSSIGNALVMIGEANSRVRRAEALNAMSDAELAKHGLKREDITRHVFGDLFYI